MKKKEMKASNDTLLPFTVKNDINSELHFILID